MNRFMLWVVVLMGWMTTTAMATAPATLWSNVYTKPNGQRCDAAIQLADGGNVLVGTNNGDWYVVRIDANGDTLWTRSYNLGGDDRAEAVVQGSDGDLYVAGTMYSSMMRLVRHNILTGDTVWTRRYLNTQIARAIRQTADGGFALGGVGNYSGAGDQFVLLRTNANGDSLWSRKFGGPYAEDCLALCVMDDGGFALTGMKEITDNNREAWLVRTDANGDSLWAHFYGGSGNDYGYGLTRTSDGGFAIAGCTGSWGAGDLDYWLVKTDADGAMEWNRTYGYTRADFCYSVQQLPDNGYILGGHTSISGATDYDVWLVRTNAAGDTLWTKKFGTPGSWEECRSAGWNPAYGYWAAGTWGGNPGDLWAAHLETDITPVLRVVGPGYGDEWRVDQRGGGVQWFAQYLTCCINVDLYRNGNFVMNLATCVPAARETLSVNVPCDMPAGYGYQIYVESSCNPAIHDLGDPFTIRPCDYGFGVDSHTWVLCKFNECSGSIALDETSNHNDLNMLDGATRWQYGQCGTAADLTAPNAKLSSTHIIGNGWTAITLEAWILPTQLIPSTHHPLIVRYHYYTGDPAYIMELGGDGRLTGFVYNDAGDLAGIETAPGLIAAGDSHHVALTWSSGKPVRIWVDGNLVASSPNTMGGAIRASADPLTVGWYHDTGYGDFYYHGYLDEVRISDISRYNPPESVTVVRPSPADEWRIGQYGVPLEWTSQNVYGCVNLKLYRGNDYVTDIAACIAVDRDTLSWHVPCDLESRTDYRIYIESADDPAIHDFGDPFIVRENFMPDTVSDLSIQHVGDDALLNWSPVTTDTTGAPLCPHVYLIYFESTFRENPDFLALTSDTTYTHLNVVRFSNMMFYSVDVYLGDIPTLQMALHDLGEHPKRSEIIQRMESMNREAVAKE